MFYRYIENTTIEIENELAHGSAGRRRSEEDDLLRRQEEFINANRAGLRRRLDINICCVLKFNYVL